MGGTGGIDLPPSRLSDTGEPTGREFFRRIVLCSACRVQCISETRCFCGSNLALPYHEVQEFVHAKRLHIVVLRCDACIVVIA